MSNAKLEKTILRFKSKIESGAYYEAHQTLRTITNRYVKSKQYKDAIDLLYQGSSTLASKKEYASASDLIGYLIQVYSDFDIVCDEQENQEYKLKLIELVNYLPDSDPSLPDLAKQSISWSQKGSKSKFGDSDLHHVFGVKFLNSVKESEIPEVERQKLFSFAELHLILGTADSLPYYINFLWEWFEASKSQEMDPGVFLGRAVINYAYSKNIHLVKESVSLFLKKLTNEYTNFEIMEKGDQKIYFFDEDTNFSLINFFQLLALTLTKENSGQKFLKLYNQYKPELKKHGFNNSIDYLGRFYFNLKLGNPEGGQNMFANLMGGLFK